MTVFLAFYALAMGIAYKGYHNMGYAVREKDILFKSGVIFKNTIVIPFNRVQHSEITQGPIDRWYGLYELNIYTAGGSGSDLNIPGLRQDNALKIKDFFNQNVMTLDEEE